MSFVYGIVFVMVGSVSANLGNNLVSLGHINTHNDNLTKEKSSKEVKSEPDSPVGGALVPNKGGVPAERSWTTIGRFIFVIGNLFNFAAFAFGAQSILSSLESVEFVSNVFFVHYVHCEPITARMSIGTLFIIAGNVLVVVFGEQGAKDFTSDDMIHLYKHNTAYHAYLLLVFILWAVTSYAYTTYHHSRMKKRVLMWRHSFVEPLCYAVSSSIVGTQAVLNSKCLALLIDATSTGAKNEFAFWYLYMVLATWLLMVAYWLIRLDQGLALFPPAFIIPLMQVVFMIFAILCGGIYFKEFIHFSTTQYILFSVGVVLIVFGVYGLAPLDMKLYVPGDPDAPDPVLLCEQAYTANVHSELILPVCSHCKNHRHGPLAAFCAVCKYEDTELDRMFDGALHDKPQPTYEDMTGFSDAKVHPIMTGAEAVTETDLEKAPGGFVLHKPSVNDLTDLTEDVQHFATLQEDKVKVVDEKEVEAGALIEAPVTAEVADAVLESQAQSVDVAHDEDGADGVQHFDDVGSEPEPVDERDTAGEHDDQNFTSLDTESEVLHHEEPYEEASSVAVFDTPALSARGGVVDSAKHGPVHDEVTDFIDASNVIDTPADAAPVTEHVSVVAGDDANNSDATIGAVEEIVEADKSTPNDAFLPVDLAAAVVEEASIEDMEVDRDNVIDFAQPQMVPRPVPEIRAVFEEPLVKKETKKKDASLKETQPVVNASPISPSKSPIEEEKAVFEVAIHQKTQLSQPDQEDDDGEDFEVIELNTTDTAAPEASVEDTHAANVFAVNENRARTAPSALKGPSVSLLPTEEPEGSVGRALVNNYTTTATVMPFADKASAADKYQHFDAPDGTRGAPPVYAIASKSRRAAPSPQPHSYSLRADASETNPQTD